jgi:hypothetical protein
VEEPEPGVVEVPLVPEEPPVDEEPPEEDPEPLSAQPATIWEAKASAPARVRTRPKRGEGWWMDGMDMGRSWKMARDGPG